MKTNLKNGMNYSYKLIAMMILIANNWIEKQGSWSEEDYGVYDHLYWLFKNESDYSTFRNNN